MSEEIKRIVIAEKNIFGDLSKCKICNTNFTAISPCIVCQLIIEKEQDLGRRLTREEFDELMSKLFGYRKK